MIRQIMHQNAQKFLFHHKNNITTSTFGLKPKENNENDMTLVVWAVIVFGPWVWPLSACHHYVLEDSTIEQLHETKWFRLLWHKNIHMYIYYPWQCYILPFCTHYLDCQMKAWLCIITGLSKMTLPMCSNFSHLFLTV